MIDTIKEELGENSTAELITAWKKILIYVTDEMRKYTD